MGFCLLCCLYIYFLKLTNPFGKVEGRFRSIPSPPFFFASFFSFVKHFSFPIFRHLLRLPLLPLFLCSIKHPIVFAIFVRFRQETACLKPLAALAPLAVPCFHLSLFVSLSPISIFILLTSLAFFSFFFLPRTERASLL